VETVCWQGVLLSKQHLKCSYLLDSLMDHVDIKPLQVWVFDVH